MNGTRTLDREKDLLRDAMSRANGKPFRGKKAVIFVGSNNGHASAGKYLSGMPYLFSMFAERAYETDEQQARQWIKRYPLALEMARVISREA